MIQSKTVANAVTTVFAITYIACAVIAFIAPDFSFGVLSTWFHAFNLNPVKATTQMAIPSTIFGFITFSMYIWVTTFAIATLYKKWAK